MKKVLILGAGMVVRPIVKYLLDKGYLVTVATRTKSKADAMIDGHPNGTSMAWTVDDEETLGRLISEHDLTVSLLPYAYHLMVARKCIAHKKNMVTTSYMKPEMQALNQEAKDAGIVIILELGLDPGIDHMSAMRIIDHVHNKGGKIEEFYSITGALPAPEACDNPFNYKFSWSPKGVVLASKNDGRYLRHGNEIYVPPEDRNDPSTQGTLVFNPENPRHKLLGGHFIAFDWKFKEIRQERSYWIWDFTSEPSEKALLAAIYAFFQEEFLFQQGEHSSVLGKRIRDVVTCGFAIGRIDLPTLHIRSQQYHVADPISLFNVFLKTKIIDLKLIFQHLS